MISEYVIILNIYKLKTLSDNTVEYKSYLINQNNRLTYNAIVFGDSRILSLNAKYISEKVSESSNKEFNLYNFSTPNHGIRSYYLLLKKYLKNHQKPDYIIFSSAPLNISGEWSLDNTHENIGFIHRMVQMYSLNEMVEVLPFKVFMTSICVKFERLSMLILYRARIKKAIRKPELHFKDRMAFVLKSSRLYNGGIIFNRNKKLTQKEIRNSEYFDFPIEINDQMVYWYEKFFSLAENNGTRILIVNAPMHYEIIQNREADGSHDRYRQLLNRWQKKFDNIDILGSVFRGYELDYFNDWEHLNVRGTRKFTFEISDQLSRYLNDSKINEMN